MFNATGKRRLPHLIKQPRLRANVGPCYTRWVAMRASLLVGVAMMLGCPHTTVMKPKRSGPVTQVPDLTEPAGCGPHDVNALMACVSARRIADDVERIAKPRAPGTAHHQRVLDECEKRFAELDFDVARHPYATGVNVTGTKPGFNKPSELVIVGAHFDQRGDCAGANDNASGVAALFELARVLATGRFARTLVVTCWDEGSRGQLGSQAHARRAHEVGADVRLATSIEAIAFASRAPDSQRVPEGFEQLFPDQSLALLDNDFRADFLTVVAESATERWANRLTTHGAQVGLSVHVLTLTERMKVKQRELHRSDHVSFWEQAFPAMLVTDSGPFRNEQNSCMNGPDTVGRLDFRFAAQATQATVGAITDALELR